MNVVDSTEARYAAGLCDATAWLPHATEDELLELAEADRVGLWVFVREGHSLIDFYGDSRPSPRSEFSVVEILDARCSGYSAGFFRAVKDSRPDLFDATEE